MHCKHVYVCERLADNNNEIQVQFSRFLLCQSDDTEFGALSNYQYVFWRIDVAALIQTELI